MFEGTSKIIFEGFKIQCCSLFLPKLSFQHLLMIFVDPSPDLQNFEATTKSRSVFQEAEVGRGSMRIQAVVEVVNRDVNMGTKPTRSSLALGKIAKNSDTTEVFLMLNTSSNRSGTKFKLCSGNVEKVFDKFVNQGKCTIQLKSPCKTIIISKADPLQLKALLGLLKKVVTAKTSQELDKISLSAGAMTPVSASLLTKPKERLVVTKKQDYPITKSFPHTLTELRIIGINLKRIDGRIFKLSKLTILDLSGNNISEVPETISNLKQLKELNLSKNKLSALQRSFFTSVPQDLRLLDLSYNQLEMIPFSLQNFKFLATLNLSANKLKRLPVTIGKLKGLKKLELAGNQLLNVLPGTFTNLRLDHLSLSSTTLTSDVSGIGLKDSTSEVARLVDICLLSCSQHNLRSQVNETILPLNLLDYWDTIQTCSCGRLCPWSSCARGIIKTNPRTVAQTFVTDGTIIESNIYVRCETIFCSPKCLSLYKNQPLNYR